MVFPLRQLRARCIFLVSLSLFVNPLHAAERISGTSENQATPAVNRSTSLMTTTVDFQILLTSDSHSATAANVAPCSIAGGTNNSAAIAQVTALF